MVDSKENRWWDLGKLKGLKCSLFLYENINSLNKYFQWKRGDPEILLWIEFLGSIFQRWHYQRPEKAKEESIEKEDTADSEKRNTATAQD